MAELNPNDIEVSGMMAAQEASETAAKPAKEADNGVTTDLQPAEVSDGDAGVQAGVAADDASAAAEEDGKTDEVADDKADKERSKPASKRIAEITKARREAERRAELAEAELARLRSGQAPANDTTNEKPDPNDAKYDFGEADPNYIADLVEWKAEQKFAERDKKAQAEAEQANIAAKGAALDAQWKEKAERAVEKYPDFNEVVTEAAANKEWPLLPLSAAAVASSDFGDDVAYHLATHPEDAKRLASAEQDFHAAYQAALQAGLSREVATLMAKPHLSRATEMFEGIEGKFKSAPKPQAKIATDAPEPPAQRARGAGGQFTQDFSSDDCDLAKLNKAIRG